MKAGITTFLAAFGLAPASRVANLTAEVQRGGAKVAQLETRLEQLRADAESWKRRCDDMATALAEWKQLARRAEADVERIQATADQLEIARARAKTETGQERARVEEWRGRAEALTRELRTVNAELEDVRTRLRDKRTRFNTGQRATKAVSEQLMAMEVKLDLIEAAIQVLDMRTHEQSPRERAVNAIPSP
jgi:chromosome segregation ATPase